MERRRNFALILLACVWLAVPASAGAQTIGLGPRIAFVRGDATQPDTASVRYIGGLLRARTSPRTAIELALDYRTVTDETLTHKTRDLPFQGSLLLYPFRSPLSMYLLGGVGWYNQKVETLVPPVSETSTTKMGYHAGLGGELMLGRRAALHLDYRYTFIHFGDQGTTPTSGGAIPVPGLISLQEKLKLSHEGLMWTTGVVVYF
jgi:hypothetical protein